MWNIKYKNDVHKKNFCSCKNILFQKKFIMTKLTGYWAVVYIMTEKEKMVLQKK